MPRQRPTSKMPDIEPSSSNVNPVQIDDSPEYIASGSSDEEYEDDPVVKTYDVFLSDQLADQIYLVQYPIRNPDEQYYDDNAALGARIKPNEGVLEVDVPISASNSYFERKDTNEIDRQTLSGRTQRNQANYFVGVFQGDQLHLSPVKATVQLRPSFQHFDAAKAGERRRKQPEEVSRPRAVQLQVKSSDDPRTSSVQHIHEDFIPLQWIDTMDPETVDITNRLVSTEMSREFVSSVSGEEFISQLFSSKDGKDDTHPVKMEL